MQSSVHAQMISMSECTEAETPDLAFYVAKLFTVSIVYDRKLHDHSHPQHLERRCRFSLGTKKVTFDLYMSATIAKCCIDTLT